MIVRFEPNVPQRLTLRFAAGKQVEGQFGTQFLHQLTDGNRVYLSPVAEQQLAHLGVRDGEPVEICKRETWIENRRQIEWQVARVQPELPGSNPTAPEPISSDSVDHRPESEEILQKPPMDRAMTMYLIMAGRCTREAEQLLGAEGGAVRFDSRDITALATTCLIQSFKEGWLNYLTPETAQQYDGEHLVHQRKAKPAASETNTQPPEHRIAANGCNFPAADKAWTTRGEMKAVFAHLRELVGEVDYAHEMEHAGVSSAEQLHDVNDARACYQRLVAIAQKEAA